MVQNAIDISALHVHLLSPINRNDLSFRSKSGICLNGNSHDLINEMRNSGKYTILKVIVEIEFDLTRSFDTPNHQFYVSKSIHA